MVTAVGPSVQAIPATHANDDLDPTWKSWTHGLAAKTHKTTRDRFTIAKTKHYLDYSRTTSLSWRVTIVILSAVPGLLVSLVAPLVPLQSPTQGVLQNDQFYIHFLVTLVFTIFGAMIQARAATGLTHSEYTTFDIVCVAVVASLHLLGFMTLLGYYWRYPVPFSWVIASLPWMLCLVWSHVLVLRTRLYSTRLRSRLLFYMPSLAMQVSQIVVYPVYSAIFEVAGEQWQPLVILAFPVVKMLLRQNISKVSHHLGDFAREIAVCSVEISASMYQSMIMQNTPSVLATVMVIGLDVAMGFVAVKHFTGHKGIVPQDEIVTTAFRILERGQFAIQDQQLNKYGMKRTNVWSSMLTRLKRSTQVSSVAAITAPGSGVARAKAESGETVANSSHNADRLVVTHALEILQTAESILLVEYIEVAVPIVNTVYLFVASHLKSAVYNPKLAAFYLDKSLLLPAMESILLYAALQGVTVFVMCLVIQFRFKLSALSLLAFALESQVWSMQGKLIAWLPVILAFSVAHYGVDFTFKFNFRPQQGIDTFVALLHGLFAHMSEQIMHLVFALECMFLSAACDITTRLKALG